MQITHKNQKKSVNKHIDGMKSSTTSNNTLVFRRKMASSCVVGVSKTEKRLYLGMKSLFHNFFSTFIVKDRELGVIASHSKIKLEADQLPPPTDYRHTDNHLRVVMMVVPLDCCTLQSRAPKIDCCTPEI